MGVGMRGISIVGLALAGVVATAPVALAGDWDGFVDIGGSWSKVDFSITGVPFPPGLGITTWSGDLRASASRDFNARWGFQVDVLASDRVVRESLGGLSEQNDNPTGDVALHLYKRPGNWLFGAILQYGGDLDESDPLTHLYAGVEGQAHWGKLTLYGQLAYYQLRESSDSVDGWATSFQARYFPTPGCLLQAQATYTALSELSDLDIWTLAVGGEHQFRSSPFSVYARYEHQQLAFSGMGVTETLRSDGVVAGFRWAFGAENKSLEERNNRGTTLDPFGGTTLFGGGGL